MSEKRKDGNGTAPSRRAILTGIGAAGIGALASGTAFGESMQEPEGRSPEAARQAQPFYGEHQAGVTTPVSLSFRNRHALPQWRSSVSAITEGVSATAMLAFLMASILPSAVPLPPETIAPA